MEHLQASPVPALPIKTWTDRDLVLSKVRKLVADGWPPSVEISDVLQPYAHRKLEQNVEDGCLLWGRWVVVQPQGWAKVVEEP